MPAVHEWVITGAYGLLSLKMLVEALRLKPIRRKKAGSSELPTLLLTGKDKEAWLAENLPLLMAEGFRIYYFDLGSSDESVETASRCGATVLKGVLPEHARPENFGFYRLALAASEDSPDDWWAFMPLTGKADQGIGEELSSWIKENGRKHSHLVGLASSDPQPLGDALQSQWKELSRGILCFADDSGGFIPKGEAVGCPIHLWRASSVLHRVSEDPHPPFFGLLEAGHVASEREVRILWRWTRKPIYGPEDSALAALSALVYSTVWIAAGALWQPAFIFVMISYLAAALTSKSVLKALAVLPFSVAIALGIVLRIRFIGHSKRN